MTTGLLMVTAAVATALVVVLAIALVRALRHRRRVEASLAAARDELSAVHRRLDALARRVETRTVQDEQEYVITTAGDLALVPTIDRAPVAEGPAEPVSARQFASVAVGESLVTLLSLGHGLRRALSAENRNRISFEMRREVRRSRKQRKEDIKQARRHVRGAGSVAGDAA